MGQINMSNQNRASPTQSNNVQAHENQLMKRSIDISGIFKKKNSKLPIKNIGTLSQKQKIEKTFSPSHDMVEDVGSGGKLFGEQDSLVDIWIVIGESGLVHLLKNVYERRTQHQF